MGMFDGAGNDIGDVLDPGGFFEEGGILGPQKDPAAVQAQAEFLRRMMGREGELYPELKAQLQNAGLLNDQALQAVLSGAGPEYDQAMQSLSQAASLAPEAFQAATGDINREYRSSSGEIDAASRRAQNFEMAPEALAALDNIRETRLKNIDSDVTNLVGSRVADLAKRGMLSSSTAEGSMGEVGKAIAPAINQTEEDYWSSRLAIPGQQYQTAADAAGRKFGMASTVGGANASAYQTMADNLTKLGTQRYGLAVGESQRKADALNQNRQNLLAPYLDMWKTSAGIGATQPTVTPDNSGQRAGAVGSILAAALA